MVYPRRCTAATFRRVDRVLLRKACMTAVNEKGEESLKQEMRRKRAKVVNREGPQAGEREGERISTVVVFMTENAGS